MLSNRQFYQTTKFKTMLLESQLKLQQHAIGCEQRYQFCFNSKSYTYIPLFRLPYKAVLTEITVPTLQRNFAKLCSHVVMFLCPLGAGKHENK